MRRDPLLPEGQAPRWDVLVPRALLCAQSAAPVLRGTLGEPSCGKRAMSLGERAGGGGSGDDAQKSSPAGSGGGGRPATTAGSRAVSALCLLLSVGSAAACLLLGAQAAALQGRVSALEEERELLRRSGPPGTLDAWAEPHLERLLREVRRSGAGQGWSHRNPGTGELGEGQCSESQGRRVCCPGEGSPWGWAL